MLKRIASVSVILVGTLSVGLAAGRRADPGLTVHEWGTFTSVAGAGGRAIEWLPLGGPTDLPCSGCPGVTWKRVVNGATKFEARRSTGQ